MDDRNVMRHLRDDNDKSWVCQFCRHPFPWSVKPERVRHHLTRMCESAPEDVKEAAQRIEEEAVEAAEFSISVEGSRTASTSVARTASRSVASFSVAQAARRIEEEAVEADEFSASVEGNDSNFKAKTEGSKYECQEFQRVEEEVSSVKRTRREGIVQSSNKRHKSMPNALPIAPEVEVLEGIEETGESASLTNRPVGDAFGRNVEKKWSWLIDDQVLRVGIYGMGGVDKATLMRHIMTLLEGQSSFENPQNAQAVGAEAPILEKRFSELASMGNAGQLEEFSLQELLESTDNFSDDCKIVTGSFGVVYHGVLQYGREVAIKRAELSSTSTAYATGTRRQEDKDNAFINELESLSRLHHKNLVRLLGFYYDSNERILVYEFMKNGSLHDHLHKIQCSPLMSWTALIKVALDAARGIEYIHEYAVPRIIHCDIKSSNILLDLNWTAKVSDFGPSLMGPEDIESHLSLLGAGTMGYMDPESYILQQFTTKSDVYSFGVLLLEILSGGKAIHKNENGERRNVVDYIAPYIVQDEIHRVLDKRVPPPTPFEIEAVVYIGYLAADCVLLERRDRPSMSDIVNSLDRALAACLVHPNSLSRSTTGSST